MMPTGAETSTDVLQVDPRPRERTIRRLVVAVVCLAAAMVYWYGTRWGIGLSPDSAFYIRTARQILGKQLAAPAGVESAQASHYPPGYPFVLAAASLVGWNTITAARAVNLVLFVLNAGLTGWLVSRVTRGSILAAALATLFVIFAPPSVLLHMTALSEGLFIALTLTTLALLDVYLRRQRYPWLIAAALIAGAAMITRYAGVSLGATGGLVILLLEHKSWLKRFRDGIVFGLISIVPLATLATINTLRSGTAVNRPFVYHPISAQHFKHGMIGASQWLIPDGLSRPRTILVGEAMLAAGIVVGIMVWLKRKPKSADQTELDAAPPELSQMHRIGSLFILTYVLLLVFSISFVDYHTQPDQRLLSPLMFVATIVIAWWCTRFWNRRWIKFALAVVVAIVVASTVQQGAKLVSALHAGGGGYASRSWQRSPLVRAIRALPGNPVVYSNAADVIYLVTQRPAAPIPALVIETAAGENVHYEVGAQALKRELASGRAVVAFFNKFEHSRPYYPTQDELKKQLGLHRILRTRDGALYDYVAPTTAATTAAATMPTTTTTAPFRRPTKASRKRKLTTQSPAATIPRPDSSGGSP